MKITFLRNEKCAAWKTAREELKLALDKLKLKEEVDEKEITTQEEAERYRFLGSPTILINGEDIDLSIEEKEKEYSPDTCRIYFFQGEYHEYPPMEMIIDALRKHMV